MSAKSLSSTFLLNSQYFQNQTNPMKRGCFLSQDLYFFMVNTYSLPGSILLFISKWLLPIFTQELYFSKNNWRLENMYYPVLAQDLYFPKRKFRLRTVLTTSKNCECKFKLPQTIQSHQFSQDRNCNELQKNSF